MKGQREVIEGGVTFWELWPGGVHTGHSIECPTCGHRRNLTWVPSGMEKVEALKRLVQWSQCCPGSPEDHKRTGGALLKGFGA